MWIQNTDISKLNYNDLTCVYNESEGNSKDLYITKIIRWN